MRKRVAARSAGPAGANVMARPETTSRAPSVWCQARRAGEAGPRPVGSAHTSGLASSSAPKARVETPSRRDRTGTGRVLSVEGSGEGSGGKGWLERDGDALRDGARQGVRDVGSHRFDPGRAENRVAGEPVPLQGAAEHGVPARGGEPGDARSRSGGPQREVRR